VPISSLMLGAAASKEAILIAGVAGLFGRTSSVETRDLASHPRAELNELALIYMKRGLPKDLAMKVVAIEQP